MFFIIGLLLGGAVVIFILQNITVTTVNFFAWHITGSLAIILIISILCGIIITLLMVLPGSIENYWSYRKLAKDYKKLEEELRRQKELTVFAKKVPPTPENIANIENGAIQNPDR
jgi:uncharacterized integral membrane protein